MKINIKFTLLIIAILFIACSDYRKNDYWDLTQTDIERAGWRGQIKSRIDSTFAVKSSFGELIIDSLISTSKNIFDRKGNTLVSNNWSYTYKYHNQRVIMLARENGQIKKKSIKILNSKKMPIRLDQFDEKGMQESRIDWEYNEQNQLESMIIFGSDGKIKERFYSFEYDKKNHPLRVTHAEWENEDEIEYVKYEYSHNDRGILEEITEYKSDNGEDWVISTRTILVCNDDKVETQTEYIYNYKGDLEAKICHFFDKKKWKIKEIMYNEKGELNKDYQAN